MPAPVCAGGARGGKNGERERAGRQSERERRTSKDKRSRANELGFLGLCGSGLSVWAGCSHQKKGPQHLAVAHYAAVVALKDRGDDACLLARAAVHVLLRTRIKAGAKGA